MQMTSTEVRRNKVVRFTRHLQVGMYNLKGHLPSPIPCLPRRFKSLREART